MSKIKNGGLDLYGKMYGLNGIGGERVKDDEAMIMTDTHSRRKTGVCSSVK